MVLEKYAGENERFGVTWSRALAPNATSISQSTWTIEEVAATATIGTSSTVATRTSVILQGGAAGETVTLVNTVVTADGQTLIKKLVVNIL